MREDILEDEREAGDDDLQPPPVKRFRAKTSGPNRCVVPDCSSFSKADGVRLSYKHFPTGYLMGRKWMKVLGNSALLEKSLKELGNCRVCGNHFCPTDKHPSGRLKKGVIPTLYLPDPLSDAQLKEWVEPDPLDHLLNQWLSPRNIFDEPADDLNDIVNQSVNQLSPGNDVASASSTARNIFDEPADDLNDIVNQSGNQLSPGNNVDSASSTDVLRPLLPGEIEVTPLVCVQGTFHQGQREQFSDDSFGKQCTANAAYSIAMASCFKPGDWSASTMDQILKDGDRYYIEAVLKIARATKQQPNYQYLYTEEVCTSYQIRNSQVDLEITAVEFNVDHPDEALPTKLRAAFTSENCFAVLLVSYDETVAIWRDGTDSNKYWMFDSHARDQNGKRHPEGKSFCGCFSSLEHVVRAHYASHRDANGLVVSGRYEISKVTVTVCDESQSVPAENLRGGSETNMEETDLLSNGMTCDQGSVTIPPNETEQASTSANRRKRTRTNSRYTRRLRNLAETELASISHHNQSDPEKAELITKCRILGNLLKDVIRRYEYLKTQIHDLKKLSVREFLSEKEVSEELIAMVECEVRNHDKHPAGNRYKPTDIERAIGYKSSGGNSGLEFTRQISKNPSRQTVRRAMKGFDFEMGISEDTLCMRHLRYLFLSNEDRAFKMVVLAFDETAITEHLTLQPGKGTVLGFADSGNGDRHPTLANKFFVMLAQGLLMDWMFPCGLMLVTGTIKGLSLADIIVKATSAIQHLGGNVILTVCDQSAPNIKAIKTLMARFPVIKNGSRLESQFEVSGKPVISTYDSPHIAKCVRNAMLGGEGSDVVTGSIEWPIDVDGRGVIHEMPWTEFDKLRALLGNDWKLADKLSDAHITPNKKMKVKYALQIFSAKNATLFHRSRDLLPNASKNAQVVRELDELFDLCIGHSSREPFDTMKEARKPMSATSIHMRRFPVYLEKLKKVKFWSYRRCKNNRTGHVEVKKFPSLSVVPQTWPHTIKALIHLYELLVELNIDSCNIRRALQDFLESLFGRCKSGRKNSTPLQILEGLKVACISRVLKPKSRDTNCDEEGKVYTGSLQQFMSYGVKDQECQGRDGNLEPSVCVQGIEENCSEEEVIEEDGSEEEDFPVLSLEESDILDIQEGPQTEYEYCDAVKMAVKVNKQVLKSKCKSCSTLLTTSNPTQLHFLAIEINSLSVSSLLPSEKLIDLVREAKKIFQNLCQDHIHEDDPLSMVNKNLTENIQLSSWFTCEAPGHFSNVFSKLSEALVREHITFLNKQVKKGPRRKNRDPHTVQNLVANCFADDNEDLAQEMEEQLVDDIDAMEGAQRQPNSNPLLLVQSSSSVVSSAASRALEVASSIGTSTGIPIRTVQPILQVATARDTIGGRSMSLAPPATTLLLRAATPQSKQSIQPPGQPGQKVTPVKIGHRVPLATMLKTCLVPIKTASSIQTFRTRKVDNPQVVTCSAQGAALQPGRVLPQGSKLVTIIHNVTGKRTSVIVKSGAAPPAGLGRGGGLNIQSGALRTMQTINSAQAGHGTGVCCVQASPGEPVAEKTGVSNDGEKNITQGMGPELVDDSGVFEEIEEAEQQSNSNPQILQELMVFCGISEDVE